MSNLDERIARILKENHTMGHIDYLTCAPTEANFREFVDYLFQMKREGADGFHHAATGLAGEAGEVLDHTKKHWVYGRDLDLEKVFEEMGDTIHYFMMLMIKLEEYTGQKISFATFIGNNMVKLRKRYPNGFTKEAAIARADKAG